MACGRAGDLSGNSSEAFLYKLPEAPSGAVAGEHAEIVEVDIAVPVGIGDLLIINFAEPVVGCDGTGV